MSTHQDVIAVGTGRPVPAEPQSEPAVVNTHPGPDFPYLNEAAA